MTSRYQENPTFNDWCIFSYCSLEITTSITSSFHYLLKIFLQQFYQHESRVSWSKQLACMSLDYLQRPTVTWDQVFKSRSHWHSKACVSVVQLLTPAYLLKLSVKITRHISPTFRLSAAQVMHTLHTDTNNRSFPWPRSGQRVREGHTQVATTLSVNGDKCS
jgi:hypothetical protein